MNFLDWMLFFSLPPFRKDCNTGESLLWERRPVFTSTLLHCWKATEQYYHGSFCHTEPLPVPRSVTCNRVSRARTPSHESRVLRVPACCRRWLLLHARYPLLFYVVPCPDLVGGTWHGMASSSLNYLYKLGVSFTCCKQTQHQYISVTQGVY